MPLRSTWALLALTHLAPSVCSSVKSALLLDDEDGADVVDDEVLDDVITDDVTEEDASDDELMTDEKTDEETDDELLLITALDELAALLAGVDGVPSEPLPQATRPKKLILETRLNALTLRPRARRWTLYMVRLRFYCYCPFTGSIKFLLCRAITRHNSGRAALG